MSQLIDQKIVEEAYQQVEQIIGDAVKSATTELEFKTNLGRLQLVAQRTLAIMVFNSCYGTKQNPFDMLNKVSEGIKRELEQIVEAAKKGQEYLSSVDAQLHRDDQPMNKEH